MYAFLTFDDEKDARDLVESSKPHLIHGDTLNVAYASPIVKDGNKKKTAHGFFEDMMTQYMSRAMDGYFGKDWFIAFFPSFNRVGKILRCRFFFKIHFRKGEERD